MAAKTPVYFFSHGGPNTLYESDHPVFPQFQKVGKEITQQVKPKAVIVVSAHWQAGPSHVEVNAAENEDIIYDFYGFPASYYQKKYPNTGSPQLADQVASLLQTNDIKVRKTKRGLDHGVWVPFSIAFDPENNPLNVPIVQVSLYDNDEPTLHYNLGRALEPLRSQGVLMIVSGMAVHNLRDVRLYLSRPKPKPLPYTTSFDAALKEAATASPDKREQKLAALLDRDDARKAHPTFEHLLPIYVGAGAAPLENCTQLFTMEDVCLSWAQYRFGEVA